MTDHPVTIVDDHGYALIAVGGPHPWQRALIRATIARRWDRSPQAHPVTTSARLERAERLFRATLELLGTMPAPRRIRPAHLRRHL